MQRLVRLEVLALLVVMFVGGRARAEDAAAARALYKDATLHYNVGEYTQALDKFKAAYLALPDPAFLFNIGQCQRQLGQYDAASKSYRTFLRESPNLSEQTRADVQRLIAEMEEALRDQRAKSPPTGTRPPEGAGQPAPASPAEAPRPSPPPPPAIPPPPPPRPWYKNPLGMSLAAGGIAGVVVGGALLGKSLGDDHSARNAGSLPDQNRFHDSAVTFNTAGWVVAGVGLAALAGGAIVLALSARHHAHHEERAQVTP